MTTMQSASKVAPALSPEEAERLSMRIGLKLEASADAWEGAKDLLREAIALDVYKTLGFKSHGQYVKERFGGALARLDLEHRREMVAELTAAGMSTRAIAPVFDVSAMTISKDQRAGVNPVYNSDLDNSHGDGGNDIPSRIDSRNAVEVQAEGGDLARTVTSLDGKEHKVLMNKLPRRKKITDSAYDLRRDLIKMVFCLEKFMNDDRIAANRDALLDILETPLQKLEERAGDVSFEIVGGLKGFKKRKAERDEQHGA